MSYIMIFNIAKLFRLHFLREIIFYSLAIVFYQIVTVCLAFLRWDELLLETLIRDKLC